MTYNNKFKLLLSIIGVLALLFIGSFIFSPERTNVRSSSYVWLDEKVSAHLDRISINTENQDIEFVKSSQQWFLLYENEMYPARQLRIDDFFGIFTQRNAWPVRSSSASSHINFGLQETQASRVTFFTGNTVQLDVLVGRLDSSAREVYIRRFSQDEVRSGDNRASTYITSPVTSWFNLRLFPETETRELTIDSVQRMTVFFEDETQIFSRSNRTWIVTGAEDEEYEHDSVVNYINFVLNMEGNDFAGLITDNEAAADLLFTYRRFEFEFGNGVISTVNLSEPDETGRSYAYVSGKEYIYTIPSWITHRLTFENNILSN